MGVVKRKHAREGMHVTLYLNREVMRSIQLVQKKARSEGKIAPTERQFVMEAVTEKIKRELDVTVRAGLRDERGDKRYYATDEDEVEEIEDAD